MKIFFVEDFVAEPDMALRGAFFGWMDVDLKVGGFES